MSEKMDIEWRDGDQRAFGEFYKDFQDPDNYQHATIEQIAQAVHRAGNDVRIFTGREFSNLPSLMITDKLMEPESGGLPAVYRGGSHRLDFSHAVPNEDREYLREGNIDEEGDFLYSLAVEEMTHALQAEQLGVTGIKGKLKQLVGKTVFSRFDDMPKFDTEGFADWTADHLGNYSWWNHRENQIREIYESKLEELFDLSEFDLEDDYHQWQINNKREELLERTLEAYTGHAFYKAFNETNPLEETIEEGFTPTRSGEINRVLETIEESSVDPVLYDELIKPYWNDEELNWKH